jgi:hypothetical protein
LFDRIFQAVDIAIDWYRDLNTDLSPSMRHQRVYVAILGGSENLEKEKGGVAVEGLKTDYRLERCSGNINKYQQIPSSSVAAMLEAWLCWQR